MVYSIEHALAGEVLLHRLEAAAAERNMIAADVPASSTCTAVISLPWSMLAFASVKGVLHQPEAKPTLKQETKLGALFSSS